MKKLVPALEALLETADELLLLVPDRSQAVGIGLDEQLAFPGQGCQQFVFADWLRFHHHQL